MSYRSRHARYGWRKAHKQGLRKASQGSINALLTDKPFMAAFQRYMFAHWDSQLRK